MNSPSVSQDTPRRSTRVRAQIPLRISSLDPAVELSEACHTLVINTEGCGVRLSRAVEPGLAVLIDELPGGTSARARVANCVPLGSEGKFWLVGIALEEPGNVWCIHPAPADWDVPVEVYTAVPLPKKKDEWPYSLFSTKGEAHPGRK